MSCDDCENFRPKKRKPIIGLCGKIPLRSSIWASSERPGAICMTLEGGEGVRIFPDGTYEVLQ